MTSEVRVSVDIKDKSSPDLMLIGYSTDYARGCMSIRQNDVYSRKIGNVSKCTIGGGMMSALHHPWALWPK